jgi:hypothetical protein
MLPLCLFLSIYLMGQAGASPGNGTKASRAHKQKPVAAPTEPATAAGAKAAGGGVRWDEMPPASPQVQFSQGLLTIHAHNATLMDVLSSVRRQTGADVEAPPSARSVRIATDLGPGPADEVLAQLLNGSRYDYVILAKPSDPHDLSYILLQEKSTAKEGALSGDNAAPPPEDVPEEVPEAAEEVPEPEQPSQEGPASSTTNNMNGELRPKTPEQLLEELKRMQQSNQQPPTAVPPNPPN